MLLPFVDQTRSLSVDSCMSFIAAFVNAVHSTSISHPRAHSHSFDTHRLPTVPHRTYLVLYFRGGDAPHHSIVPYRFAGCRVEHDIELLLTGKHCKQVACMQANVPKSIMIHSNAPSSVHLQRGLASCMLATPEESLRTLLIPYHAIQRKRW